MCSCAGWHAACPLTSQGVTCDPKNEITLSSQVDGVIVEMAETFAVGRFSRKVMFFSELRKIITNTLWLRPKDNWLLLS